MLNTYHGNFTALETSLLEEYFGFTFWKVETSIGNLDCVHVEYYIWHNTWKPEQRVHIHLVFNNVLKFIDSLGEYDTYRRPDRITRR